MKPRAFPCQELGARRLGITTLQAQRHELRGAELREAQQLQQERQRLQEEQRRLQQLNTQVGIPRDSKKMLGWIFLVVGKDFLVQFRLFCVASVVFL